MSKNRGLKLLFFKYKGSKVHLLKIEIFILFSRLMNKHGTLERSKWCSIQPNEKGSGASVMIDSTRLIDTSRIAASKNTPKNKTKKKKIPSYT